MRILSLVLVIFTYSCTSSEAGGLKEKASHKTADNNVLLELFTSQGCSSCPPADNLVNSLAQADTNLFVISFHVDYWDRLGWKDIYSSPEYTARQQQYVRDLHAESVYTPQAVIQGQFKMIGSNQASILNAIKRAREQNKEINFSTYALLDTNKVQVSYHIDNPVLSACRIVAVLVEKQSSTLVKRGENSGRKLSGFHIARAIKSIPFTNQQGSVQLNMPADLKGNASDVIVFIQNTSSGKILAVTQNHL